MVPSKGTTPDGPEVPQYFTPLTVRESYGHSEPASTSKASTSSPAGGKLKMVQLSEGPYSFG